MADLSKLPDLSAYCDLKVFLENDENKEEKITPDKFGAVFTDLNTYLNDVLYYEGTMIPAHLRDAITLCLHGVNATEIKLLKKELDKLKGSSSDFFLELLFSIIVEFNVIGRLVHKGALALGKAFAPLVVRHHTLKFFGEGLTEGVMKTMTIQNPALKGTGKIKAMVADIFVDKAGYVAKQKASNFMRDPITAFAGPTIAEIKETKAKVKQAEASKILKADLAGEISSKILQQINSYAGDVARYYNILKGDLEKIYKGYGSISLTYEVVYHLIEIHQDKRKPESDLAAVTDNTYDIVNRIIWTFILEMQDSWQKDAALSLLEDESIPNPDYPFQTANRDFEMKLQKMLVGDLPFGNSLPIAFVPGGRWYEDEFLIHELAQQFRINVGGKIDAISEHALREFPEDYVQYSDYLKRGSIPGLVEKVREMEEKATGITGTKLHPRRTHYDFEKAINKARDIYEKREVFNVLNQTKVLMTRHGLGDMSWIIAKPKEVVTTGTQ